MVWRCFSVLYPLKVTRFFLKLTTFLARINTRTILDPGNRAAHKAYRPWWHSIGSFIWGDKMPLIKRKWACMWTFVCSSGSQIKFDTRENIMESVFFSCSSLESRKNGITVAITLQRVTTLSSSVAYILMDVASSTAQRKRLLFSLFSVSDCWDWFFRKVGSRVFLS